MKIKDNRKVIYKKSEFSEAVSNSLNLERIMKDVEMFCRLDRYTGSKDGEEAAERIAQRMEELGIPVEREKYQVYRSLPRAASLRILEDRTGEAVPLTPYVYSGTAKDLEAELGTTLFLRTPHKVSLTEEGELFLQYANQILDLVNRSEEDVRERKEGLQGTLYIASVEGCGPRLFAEWIAGFQQRHPHVQYNLWNGNTDDVNTRVTKGLCEIAMITAPYNTEEFHVLPVYEEPWVAVIPKGHPLYAEENDPVKPAELLPYDLLIPSRESRKGEIDKWFEGTGHAPVIRGRIAHMMNAYELSLHGVGISIYPASISSLIRDKDVCVREVEHPDAHASYALIWNKKHTLSHVAEEFIAYVKEESGQQVYYA